MWNVIDEWLPDNFFTAVSGISGATTNPRSISQVVSGNPAHWRTHLKTLPCSVSALSRVRRLYDQVIVEGASHLRPLWQSSGQRAGWLSAQIEGGHWMSEEALVMRGLELAALAPNVMVKVPGSEQGYRAIEHLVAHGCSINNTFCFTVSQLDACLKAIHAGQQRAHAKGVSTQGAQYVISFMIGRLGAEVEFQRQARGRRINLTHGDRRWAELAVYQAMQALIRRRQTPARLLLCSIKVDIDVRGREQCWHLQRTGAGPTIYALTPKIIEFLIRRAQCGRPILPAKDWVQIPDRVLARLAALPYFNQAYFEEGLAPGAFARHPAFIRAGDDVREGMERLRGFVASAGTGSGKAVVQPLLEGLA